MRPLFLIAALSVTACTPAVAEPPQEAPRLRECNADAVQGEIGKPYRPAMADRLKQVVDARTVRVIRPGEAVTMDYRTDRLNVELDAQGRITALRCG